MSQLNGQLWSSLLHDIECAATYPKKRHFFLYRAINKYITMIEALGIVLIRYSVHHDYPYEIIYSGPDKTKMDQWLKERVTSSVDMTVTNLEKAPPIFSQAKTKFFPYPSGLLIIWHMREFDIFDEDHKQLLNYLQAISEIEKNEKLYFYDVDQPFEPELAKYIKHKDKSGITELLSLTKTIGSCDFVFWGDTDAKKIEVTSHLGSKDSGFGFQLPVGQGIGGYAAQNQSQLQVSDYKNCEYRYQEVSTAVDREDVRTVLALPIKDNHTNTTGVLYACNRKIQTFSVATKLLLRRLGQGIEPLTSKREIKQFFPKNEYGQFFKQKKAELRDIVQQSKQIAELELWLEKFIKGTVLIVNQKGKHYSNRPTNEIKKDEQPPYVFPLEQGELQNRGEVLVWTDLELPPKGWPDLIEDVISAIFIILEREERVYHLIELERSQWMNGLINRSPDLDVHYEKGVRLRIPVDQGEVWTIYWNTGDEQITSRDRLRLEEVALKWTKNPLIYSGKMGFILFDIPWPCQPEELRNQLLKELPVPTWIVHSATYSSFQALQDVLIQSRSLIERLTAFDNGKYVLEFNDFGLEQLLTNPNTAKELVSFAKKALQPIIEYDEENETQFAKTLALSLVYQSPNKVAKELFIHTNTVHYRVKRAKELLELDLEKPGNDIALKLSAYTWLYEQKFSFS